MGLKDKVERLGRKLPQPRQTHVFEWVDPETGECWYRLTTKPARNGRGCSVTEEFFEEDVPKAVKSDE